MGVAIPSASHDRSTVFVTEGLGFISHTLFNVGKQIVFPNASFDPYYPQNHPHFLRIFLLPIRNGSFVP